MATLRAFMYDHVWSESVAALAQLEAAVAMAPEDAALMPALRTLVGQLRQMDEGSRVDAG